MSAELSGWLDEQHSNLSETNAEIEKRIDAYSKEIEKLKQQQLMNVGAVAMLNEVKKVTAPETEKTD
tara:strand:+ start:245 stop:445 length:201 start_codon:yes stop_codon:yes gene_type:complete